jgi:tRNA pseudouridine55 synthase
MITTSSNRQTKLPVDGLLLLNKPAGITSNRALQTVKRLLRARKAGHTGSLDPAATGMLPLCFGEATKVCAYLLDADKTYRVVAMLGTSTDTGDADGAVTATAAAPELDRDEWQSILDEFIGDTEQVPPMYSALKQNGKRLYELARKGEVVERPARPVHISELVLLEARGSRLVFRVHCSKGTYVRTLVEDIAARAGTIAHTANLHRESVGAFRAEDMLDLPAATKLAENDGQELRSALLPVDTALLAWPQVTLSSEQASAFTGGRVIGADAGEPGLVRVYGGAGRFLGIGEADATGSVAPRRIFLLPD